MDSMSSSWSSSSSSSPLMLKSGASGLLAARVEELDDADQRIRAATPGPVPTNPVIEKGREARGDQWGPPPSEEGG
jgi:hypothetical protein